MRLGTAWKTLASPVSSIRASSAFTRLISTTWAQAPVVSGNSTSSREMSKAEEARFGVTSPGSSPRRSWAPARVATSPLCSTMTPLGVPVEPEV